jgi:nitroreductase
VTFGRGALACVATLQSFNLRFAAIRSGIRVNRMPASNQGGAMSTRAARRSQRRARPFRRNQMLAIGLAAVALFVFVTAVGIAVTLHETEKHHVATASSL